ncbi:hypothetical protein GCM10007967_17140 [Xylanimonas ulmi]
MAVTPAPAANDLALGVRILVMVYPLSTAAALPRGAAVLAQPMTCCVNALGNCDDTVMVTWTRQGPMPGVAPT